MAQKQRIFKKILSYTLIIGSLSGCRANDRSQHSGNTQSSNSSSNEIVSAVGNADDLDVQISTDSLTKHFDGYEGCIVIYDSNRSQYSVYNEDRINTRFSPCSTFKIYNSLIGLESGVLEDENTEFEWDGVQRGYDASWNQNQTLQSAVRNSVVWYFQLLASKVGEDRMRDYVEKLGYGNMDTSSGVTNFWLNKSLTISAM